MRASGRHTAPLPQGQPQPSVPSIENNFVAGLKTEYTGLNFPENAFTDATNCTINRVGNVTRRNGIDYELNASTAVINRTNSAISSYLWTNAGGQGNSSIYVLQVGTFLYFYVASNATAASPLSSTLISNINFSGFVPAGGSSPQAVECQYTSGNGYLFVFNPNTEPFYCTYSNGVVSAQPISVQIRDFAGISENIADNLRPSTSAITTVHLYNLLNQGWIGAGSSAAGGFNTTSSTFINLTASNTGLGVQNFTVSAGLSVTLGTAVTANGFLFANGHVISSNPVTISGIVNGYSGNTLSINVTQSSGYIVTNPPAQGTQWTISSPGTTSQGQLSTWVTAVGNYPSNADVWWTFKNASGVFDPTTTVANVTLGSGPAPKGFFILPSFNQQRDSASGLGTGVNFSTVKRPRTGAWFQGRVWYTGVDASATSGVGGFSYTWTESIYFSQIIQKTDQFGKCYQTNDPTSETLFGLLPSDGGVIQIQGCGSIYKLFPVQNGLLVFAANGIWFITGNQGIGFTATDFSISKLSGEHAISSTSFVDIQGYPVFWNADGIYMVAPGQSFTSGQKALEVKNLTLPTIKQFYQNIPLLSKLYARGSYNHITGIIQWAYRSTTETDVTSRYTFDSILNFLTYTEAFYPWTISTLRASINDITYVEFSGATPATSANPVFKYLVSSPAGASFNFTFAEERNNVNFTDWSSTLFPVSFTSSFTTAYKLKGMGQRKFQPQYIYVYSEVPTSGYTWQGIWDYAANNLSNKFSALQVINNNKPLFSKHIRKIRVRGNGYVLQQKVSSLDGKPFNIAGWSVLDTIGIQ